MKNPAMIGDAFSSDERVDRFIKGVPRITCEIASNLWQQMTRLGWVLEQDLPEPEENDGQQMCEAEPNPGQQKGDTDGQPTFIRRVEPVLDLETDDVMVASEDKCDVIGIKSSDLGTADVKDPADDK